jgi:peptidoglycan/xylan/chitin deacetylase (PgdA/CDA1 family)
MYFNNAGWLLSVIYPSLVWKKRVNENIIYLTFDDGPIPGITEYVLKELHKYNAKATFFCVGDNIGKHPDVFQKIVNDGHRVGNHTFNHLKGWKTDDELYVKNIMKCEEIITSTILEIPSYKVNVSLESSKKLFRPPYGLIKKSQIGKIKNEYQIIMWDVLTGDFNVKLSPEDCLKKAIKFTSQGSIVIFHDSIKAEKNLRYALPRFLDHFSSLGYRFDVL